MNKKNIFLKKLISYFPSIERVARRVYNKFTYGTFFIPINLESEINQILSKKTYKLNNKNFYKFKNKYEYFFIFSKRSNKEYSKIKLEKLLNLVRNEKAETAYDGDDFYNTEISSIKVLEFYSKEYFLENYPQRFFYIGKKFIVKNIGSNHRSYNFNGTFQLPSGGKSIGDGGDVTARLSFIPDLKGKTFLDIGSEEGYAVFNAIKKGASFAKGLNIEETIEYDYFPEYFRPAQITSRERNQIDITQKFLTKEYDLESNKNFKFEYNNIYNLGDEKFDFVFCFGVLYHLKNPYLAIENLYKITNETLILETQGIKNDKYLNARILEKDGFVRHSSNSLAFLLKRAGFKKVEILVDAYSSSLDVMNIVLKAEK